MQGQTTDHQCLN